MTKLKKDQNRIRRYCKTCYKPFDRRGLYSRYCMKCSKSSRYLALKNLVYKGKIWNRTSGELSHAFNLFLFKKTLIEAFKGKNMILEMRLKK